jgi:hypothetical protein
MYRVLPLVLLSCADHVGFAQKIRKKFKFGRIEANTELSNSNVTARVLDYIW